jgi:hypothetical protein
MSELVVINSTFLKRDTTHVVICEGCVEVVAEFAGGGQRQVIEVKSTTWRHEDYAFYPGHKYQTYSVREKKMREGIDLGTNRPA